MEISELLGEEDIALDIRAKSKLSALSKIASRMAKRNGLDERAVREGLLARERAGSTAVGSGVAVPHALLEHLSRPTGSLTRLVQPIRFEAPDDAPVDLLFTMLWPRSGMTHFLPTLASVCRFLRNDAARAMLRQARSPADSLGVIWFWQREADGTPKRERESFLHACARTERGPTHDSTAAMIFCPCICNGGATNPSPHRQDCQLRPKCTLQVMEGTVSVMRI